MPPAENPLVDQRKVVALLLLSDLAAVILALRIAYLGRFEIGVLPQVPQLRSAVPPLILTAWMLSFALSGLYSSRHGVGSGYDEYRRVATASAYALALVVMVSYLYYMLPISRAFLITTWVGTMLLAVAGRFGVRLLVRRWATAGRVMRSVLIVGATEQGIGIARELAGNPAASSRVCGFLDEYQPKGATVAGLPILGEPMELHEVARAVGATHAVVVESALSWESLQFIVRTMHRKGKPSVLLAPGMFDVNATPLQMVQLGSTLLLVSQPTRIVGVEAVLKRLLDVLIGLPVFVVSLPLQAAVVVLLRLRGRPGLVWMRAHGHGGALLSVPSLAGGSIRRGHLSRLPWLWLVLIGRMSLVGPKPIADGDLERYRRWSNVLFALKPGVIGPWWLLGRSEPASLEQEIEVDLRYARAYTIWMDLRILALVAWGLSGPGGGGAMGGMVEAEGVGDGGGVAEGPLPKPPPRGGRGQRGTGRV